MQEVLDVLIGERSQKDLAATVGVHPSTLGRWRSGENEPSTAQLANLEDALGVALGTTYRMMGVVVDISDKPSPPSTELAILSDPDLDESGRRVMIDAYRGVRRRRRAR